MLARVTTFAVDGVDARRVWVEADIRQGLPAFTVVGLADKAVREARERVRAAMVNSGYEFPLRRITVNLAPAYLRKVGPAFDLPLAVALLVASYQLEPRGDRGLRGRRRAVADRRGAADPGRAGGRGGRAPRGAAPARAAALAGARGRAGAGHRGPRHRLAAGAGRDPARRRGAAVGAGRAGPDAAEPEAELADVRGHNGLIPGLEVAAAGGHNLFLQGPPGTGKTMIARRLPSILPPLAPDEAIEVTRIQSVAGLRRRRGPRDGATVPGAAPHGLGRRAGRRREPAAARRGDARPPRRPVPGRALGVRPPEPRGAAPAARGRARDDRPRPAGHGVPDELHARRRVEPLSVRPRRLALPVLAGGYDPPPAPAVRARCWIASTS